MRKALLVAVLVCTIGCGREERQINYHTVAAEAQQEADRLRKEKEDLARQLADAKAKNAEVKKKLAEDDPRLCTLEYAKAKDPAMLEDILAKQKEARAEYEKSVGEQDKKTAEADALPRPPLEDFPRAPSTSWKVYVPSVSMKAEFDDKDKRCHLRRVFGDYLEATGGSNNNWPRFIREAMDNFQDNDIEDDLEYDDYRSSARTIELFEDPGKARVLADNLLAVLVKSPVSMQWAVGMALRLDDDAQDFTRVRLQRLYKASQTNFKKLDGDIMSAVSKYLKENPDIKVVQNPGRDILGPEFDFGVSAEDGNYYKGLLLRYWRYKEEVYGRGKGDKFIKDLQKVIKEVAKGMKVNLQ